MARTRKAPAAGKAVAAAAQNGFSLISDEKLKQIYFAMLKCRSLAGRLRVLATEGNFPFKGDAIVGLEASLVGVVMGLRVGDLVAPGDRNFVAGVIAGKPLPAMFSRFARAPSTSLRAQLRIACGVAFANKLEKNQGVVVVFSQGGIARQNAWEDTLAFAGEEQLPMIFVLPPDTRTRRLKTENGSRPESYGFPVIPVDGSDVVAVHRVAYESIKRARQDRGPTLIDCQDDGDSPKDPIIFMEAYLRHRSLFRGQSKLKVLRDFEAELDEATATAR